MVFNCKAKLFTSYKHVSLVPAWEYFVCQTVEEKALNIVFFTGMQNVSLEQVYSIELSSNWRLFLSVPISVSKSQNLNEKPVEFHNINTEPERNFGI